MVASNMEQEAGYASDEEALQLDYDEACDEVVELQSELRAEKIEVQQLLMRLKAAPSKSASSRGATPSLPGRIGVIEEHRAEELRRIFLWLARHADLSNPAVLNVGFEVPIAGRKVHLQRVVQWPLPSAPGGKLKLTAPIEHKEPLGNLLASTRRSGMVDPEAILHFLGTWDLLAGELTTAAHLHPEPSVLLSQRTSSQGILIATWPSREALQDFHSKCPMAPRLGERVEVDYEGTWYMGVLHSVDAHGLASVRCDVDAPGVLTVTPLSCIRRSSARETCTTVPSASTAAAAECGTPLQQDPADTEVAARAGFAHRRTRSSAL